MFNNFILSKVDSQLPDRLTGKIFKEDFKKTVNFITLIIIREWFKKQIWNYPDLVGG